MKKRKHLKDLKRVNITIRHDEHEWLINLAFAKQTSVSSEISQIIKLAKENGFGKEEIKKLKKDL